MSTMLETLRSRVRPGKRSEGLLHVIDGVLGTAGLVASHRERLAQNTHMSDEGRRAALAGIVKDTLAKTLAEVARPYRRAQIDLEKRRMALKPPPLDKTDTVGELRRQEIRALLRNLPLAERIAVASTMTKDAEAAQAVFSSHPTLSGLPTLQFELLKKEHRETMFGPELAEIAAAAEDLATVGAAVEIAKSELAQAAGLPEQDFGRLLDELSL